MVAMSLSTTNCPSLPNRIVVLPRKGRDQCVPANVQVFQFRFKGTGWQFWFDVIQFVPNPRPNLVDSNIVWLLAAMS